MLAENGSPCCADVGNELQFSLRMTNLLERMSVENGGHKREAKHAVRNGGTVHANRASQTKRIGGSKEG